MTDTMATRTLTGVAVRSLLCTLLLDHPGSGTLDQGGPGLLPSEALGQLAPAWLPSKTISRRGGRQRTGSIHVLEPAMPR